MIRKSFVFLDGISPKFERRIWDQGINCWSDFVEKDSIKGISKKRKLKYHKQIEYVKKQLLSDNIEYLSNCLPNRERWRLYEYYKDECVYLDIEINRMNNDITAVCLYDGYETMMFVRGINLNIRDVKEVLSRYKMIVTYNGASFDLPQLRKYFNLDFPQIHVDLKPLCARIGLRGGLKEVEKLLGIERITDYEIRSGDPCKLYRLWKVTNDRHFLDLLMQYNEEDTVNLKPIAEHVMKKLSDIAS